MLETGLGRLGLVRRTRGIVVSMYGLLYGSGLRLLFTLLLWRCFGFFAAVEWLWWRMCGV